MKPENFISAGFLCMLVVLSAVSGAALPDRGATPAAVAQVTTDDEPNNDRANAIPIRDGTRVEGKTDATQNEPYDADWYSFEAEDGQAIRLGYSLDSLVASNYTIYDPRGDPILQGVFEEPDRFADGFVANETGTYHVRVVNEVEDEGGLYSFSFSIADPDSFEPNDDLDGAIPVESGERIDGKGFENDEDWFAIDAEAGETVTAQVRLLELYADPGQNLRVDIFNGNGERVGEVVDNGSQAVSDLNRTRYDGASYAYQVAIQQVTDSEAGTYYVRVKGLEGLQGDSRTDNLGGFESYALTVSLNGTSQPTEVTPAETPEDISTLVIVGGSPENKVSYGFTYEGSVERSGKSHGAPIADRHVTVDPDVDEIADSRVNGRLGGGGDAYLLTGNVTGLNVNGDAEVYLNGERVGPESFGSVAEEASPTETPTPTSTPTATDTETDTPTPTDKSATIPSGTVTSVQTTPSTENAAETSMAKESDSLTADSTANVTTADESTASGEILSGTATDTSASGPGFSLVATLVALLAVVALAVRRG